MALVAVENLGSIGLVYDTLDHEIPPEGFTSAANVRFYEGRVQKIKGEASVFGAPSISPHWLLPWKTTTQDRWIYAGVDEVYYTYNSIHTNITRFTTTLGDDDYQASARPIWSGGILHGVPILNHNGSTDKPQQWDAGMSRLKDLDNWPNTYTCKIIRPFQNFLVALDVTKGSTRYPYTVMWSHPADPGTVPTSWAPAATNLAGEQTIAQSPGFLIDCLPLASRNFLYKTDSIWSMSLNGGSSVFSFHEISNTIGALSPRCIKEFYRRHFIVGTDDIVVFDGSTVKSIATSKVRSWFFNSLHESHWDKTIVTVYQAQREIWISFVEAGSASEYLTKALIWNWDTGAFTVRDLPDIAHVSFGVVSSGGVETFNSVIGDGSIDTDIGQIASVGVSPTSVQLLFAKAYSSDALVQGDLDYDFSGVSYTSYVERLGLAIAGRDRQGNAKVDPVSVKFIRRFIPKLTAPAPVTVQIDIGAQDVLGGEVAWEGVQDFVIGTDVYLDVNVVGKYLCYRVQDSGMLPWEFTGFTLDMDIISEY